MKQPANRNKKKLLILYIVLGLGVGSMAFFAIGLALEVTAKNRGRDFYASLAVEIGPRRTPAASYRQDPPEDGGEPVSGEEYEFVPMLDFDAAREDMPGLVAWIKSEGTVIDYPIMQAGDNYYYLSRLPDGSGNNMGSVFLDCRNAADFSDRNTLIFGHNMPSGDMFGSLNYYRNQLYYEEHPVMYIYTSEKDFEVTLFAGYILDASQEVPPMRFYDESDFDRYIADIRRRSVFKSDADADFGDRIIFLCTCAAGGKKTERIIVAGILAEIVYDR